MVEIVYIKYLVRGLGVGLWWAKWPRSRFGAVSVLAKSVDEFEWEGVVWTGFDAAGEG